MVQNSPHPRGEAGGAPDAHNTASTPPHTPLTNAMTSDHTHHVGACLLKFYAQWQALTQDKWVHSVTRLGYRIPFMSQPPLRTSPIPIQPPRDPEKKRLMDEEIRAMASKRAIELVTNSESPGYYSNIFLVPKKNGKWRPVIDLSSLNKFIRCPTFKMETTRAVARALQVGEWTTSIDLQDAYFHVPIHPTARKYLRFNYEGVTWQFRALPFGLNTAPLVYTRLMSVVTGELRGNQGVVVHSYLDDWLIRSQTSRGAQQSTDKVVNLCKQLGLTINNDKSDLVPRQLFQFLGIAFDLKRAWMTPSERNIIASKQAMSVLRDSPNPTAAMYLKVIGHAVSLMEQVRLGRLHLRPIQWCLNKTWKMGVHPLSMVVQLDEPARQALNWWLHDNAVTMGIPLHTAKPTQHLYTDASADGWGACMGHHTVTAKWSAHQRNWSSNQREMQAILEAVTLWRSLLNNSVLLVATDNTTAMAHINKQGGLRSSVLYNMTLQLYGIAHEDNITITARHIQGKINLVPDMLSRPEQIFPAEWKLQLREFRNLCKRWGEPMIDAFATSLNHQLPLYYSPVPDQQAVAVDAMSQDWQGLYLYAFPPLGMLARFLARVESTTDVQVLLIAPKWPRSAWYQTIVSLLAAPPVLLRQGPRLLVQPHNNRTHADIPNLHLTAWLLSKGLWRRTATVMQ